MPQRDEGPVLHEASHLAHVRAEALGHVGKGQPALNSVDHPVSVRVAASTFRPTARSGSVHFCHSSHISHMRHTRRQPEDITCRAPPPLPACAAPSAVGWASPWPP
ncbi:hypothetical protein AFE02nite_04290 [Actinotalea fermentans]|uniref:Uncharacterized protein n=1 Tax=Actinotalea fermentans TaxID=43671 RepID=A0A511YU27_9CELL|nr:hypothetical protein AFE02nite_04290 [Actinotalea fermentans]